MAAIRYDEQNKMFCLSTKSAGYVLQIVRDGYVAHRYWGKKIPARPNNCVVFGSAKGICTPGICTPFIPGGTAVLLAIVLLYVVALLLWITVEKLNSFVMLIITAIGASLGLAGDLYRVELSVSIAADDDRVSAKLIAVIKSNGHQRLLEAYCGRPPLLTGARDP